jgi:hypothetical protein
VVQCVELDMAETELLGELRRERRLPVSADAGDRDAH